MRWVAFWSLLYVSALEFLSAVLFFSAAWSTWDTPVGRGRGLFLFSIPLGLAATALFLLLRHMWAYVLSVALALGLLGLAATALVQSLVKPPTVREGHGPGLVIGIVLGVPALLALVGLLVPPTWREVGLDVYLWRGGRSEPHG